MVQDKSLVPDEELVIRAIEEELGRELPWVDEFDDTSFGIYVQDQHVLGLALRECSLKQLPENVGKLSEIQVIDLKSCNLNRLPDGIGDLSTLRTLGLRNNNLTSLPDTLGKLQELRALSVG